MKPDQILIVQLVDTDGRRMAVSDVYVDVQFFVKGTQCYGLRNGRTDGNGQVQITYSDLEAKRLSNLEAQPWDYKQTLDGCDTKVNVSAPSMETLVRAYEIAKTFNMGKVAEDAQGWLLANNQVLVCQPADANLVGRETVVQLICRRVA